MAEHARDVDEWWLCVCACVCGGGGGGGGGSAWEGRALTHPLIAMVPPLPGLSVSKNGLRRYLRAETEV